MSASIKAPYAKVFVSLWEDEAVQGLSHVAFRVYSYFLSSKAARSLPGIFRADAPVLAALTRMKLAEVRRGLDELEHAGLIRRDHRIVWLPNTWKFNEPDAPKNVTGWVKELKAIGAERSALGREAIAALMAFLRAEKDERYTTTLDATFPQIAALFSDGVITGSIDQIQQQHQKQHQHQIQQQQSAPALAAAALGASDPDMTEVGLEASPPAAEPPEVEAEGALDRVEAEALAVWHKAPHLRRSPALTREERAALRTLRQADPAFSLVELAREAAACAFLRKPLGERRVDPTLGDLVVREDWRAQASKGGRWHNAAPGLRVVTPTPGAGSVPWEASKNPGTAEARRRAQEAAREAASGAPPPRRLDVADVERALAEALDPTARKFLEQRRRAEQRCG